MGFQVQNRLVVAFFSTFCPTSFLNVIIWIYVVLDELSENKIRIVGIHYLGGLYKKILEKVTCQKGRLFLVQTF